MGVIFFFFMRRAHVLGGLRADRRVAQPVRRALYRSLVYRLSSEMPGGVVPVAEPDLHPHLRAVLRVRSG